jgi:hypothetical protein
MREFSAAFPSPERGQGRDESKNPMKLLTSHGAVYSGVADSAGYYSGFEQYAIGPSGATFYLHWRSRAGNVPEVFEEESGKYLIRNPASEPLEVKLHFRESEPFMIAPRGTLRLDGGSIAAYMVSPRI